MDWQLCARLHREWHMDYRWLADCVVLLHAAFVLFAALGGLLVWKWPRVVWLHVPCFLWGTWVELTGRLCPLTPLENLLRVKGGAIAYQTGFVDHYLLPVLYPEGLPRTVQICLGLFVLTGNVALYVVFIARHGKKQGANNRRLSV